MRGVAVITALLAVAIGHPVLASAGQGKGPQEPHLDLTLPVMPGGVTIDLSREKAAYERRNSDRLKGLGYGIGGLAAACLSAVLYVVALHVRQTLLAEGLPVNQNERQQLVQSGQSDLTLSVLSGAAGIAGVVAGVYYLRLSFQ